MSFLLGFLIGAYIGTAIAFFLLTLFFCVLGGKGEDLWKRHFGHSFYLRSFGI